MRQRTDSAIRRLAAGVVVVACTFGSGGLASAAEDAAVEALIQRGIELRRNSADEAALTVFLEAEAQDPTSVRVLLHVVTAAQGAGKWLMADSYMRKVSALSDDPYYRRHADAIEVVRRAIAARIGTFQVDGGPDGATVRLDGQLVGTMPMAQPTSIEAGAYLMEVHKPGFYRLRRNVVISGGVLTREPVSLNKAEVRSDLGAGSGTGAVGSGSEAAENRAWWAAPAVGWTLVGAGVASGIVSGVAFATRESRASTWNDESKCVPNDGTTRSAACSSYKDDAETAQTIGIVAGIAGVALGGLGLTQLILSDSSPSTETGEDSAGLKVTRCGAGLLSLSCQGSF
jgi:hypothetical protein